jgi:hypothetical protein
MRKISIDKISERENKYFVYLGNGTATEFTNKEKAQQFLNETNQFLTQQAYNINELQKLIYPFYRDNWPYFRHDKKNSKLNLFEMERFCSATLREVENCLDLSFNRSNYNNGNYFTFYHLQNACRGLKNILKELQPLSKSKSFSDRLCKIDFFFSIIVKLESDLNNYAYLGARLFKVPIHELDYEIEYIPKLSKITLKAV